MSSNLLAAEFWLCFLGNKCNCSSFSIKVEKKLMIGIFREVPRIVHENSKVACYIVAVLGYPLTPETEPVYGKRGV